MASALYESAMQAAGLSDYEVIATFTGKDCEYMKAQHPFLDRESLIIVGDHVTLESGTGLRPYGAPATGVDDYNVCHNHYPELPIPGPGRCARPHDRGGGGPSARG